MADVVRQFRANRLRDLRKKLNLSQVELGNLINSSLSTVSRWEIGERTPGGEDLTKLAQTLGTTSAYLMGETDDPSLPIRVQGKGERYADSGSQFNATANNHSTAIAGPGNNTLTSQPEQSESAFPEVKTNAALEGEGIIFEFEPGKRLMFPKGTPQGVIDATVAAVLRCYVSGDPRGGTG